MSQTQTALSRAAVECFDAAANNLRVCFRNEVLAALPHFARRRLETEWRSFVCGDVDSVPPLVYACLLGSEQCAQSLLRMDYRGTADSHFQKCVSSTVDDITARIDVECARFYH
jgi:hypothetical protein